MISYIYKLICSIFNKSNIYWDEYGVYDRDTGLMLEYYVPDIIEKEEIKEDPSLYPIISAKKSVFPYPVYQYDGGLANFAKDIANEMGAQRMNAELKKAMTFGDVDYKKEVSKILSNQIVSNVKRYSIVEYKGRLSHPTKTLWRMSLSEPILSEEKVDIFKFCHSDIYFKVMVKGYKEGLNYVYVFITIKDHDVRILPYLNPGVQIERVNYKDIKDIL